MRIENRYESVSTEVSKARADARIAWLRDWAGRHLNSRMMDERRMIPPYVALDFAREGLFGLQVSEKDGGIGLKNRDLARIVEQAAGIDLGLGSWLVTSLFPGVRPIAAFSQDPLRGEILPLLAAGRMLGGFAQTEPIAGSDFTRISTRCIPSGDGFKITGSKVWIGNGSWAGVLTVICKLCDAGGRPEDIAAFVVRSDNPGLHVGAELMSMGLRGMVQSRLSFRDAAVRRTDALGELRNGIEVGVDSMMFTRYALTAAALGAMKRSVQLMHRYTSRRTMGSGKLIDIPLTASHLGECLLRITATESLLDATSELLDTTGGCESELLVVCKLASSEFLWEVVDHFVQALGGRGYDESNLAPQMLRDARVYRVFEGASEALSDFLGSRALIDGAPGIYGFLKSQPESAKTVADLEAAVAELRAPSWRARLKDLSDEQVHGWQHALAGQLAAWAIVLGTQERAHRASPTTLSQLTLDWLRASFDAAIANATSGGRAKLTVTSTEEIASLVGAYEASIGNVEQLMPGTSEGLDPFLRRSAGDAQKA